MPAAEGKGYGKTILFGEHFVVYGLPGIASAIAQYQSAKVEASDKFLIADNRLETPGYKVEKRAEQEKSVELILKKMELDMEKTPIKITLAGDLICASGVGASAASSAAIARAVSAYQEKEFTDNYLNEIAYEGEKGYHGTPSGIDNTCATYGGLLWFEKNLEGGKNKIDLLPLKEPIPVVLGNTGITASTAEAVAEVKAAKEANPGKFQKIFDAYTEIASSARKAIEDFDLQKLGELMNKNHELLLEIGVGCPESIEIVKIARENGALGAKITGTGKGGLVLALAQNKAAQDKIASAIEKAGYSTIRTSLGKK